MTIKFTSRTEILTTIALIGILLVSIALYEELNAPIGIALVRFFVGLIVVLFLPGCFLQMALFPVKGDLDSIERVAVSIGISIAVVPPTTLILDMLPWTKLDQTTIIASDLLITGIGVVFLQVRRLGIDEKDRHYFGISIVGVAWWEAQTNVTRLLVAIFGVAMVGVMAAAFLIVFGQQPAEHDTEFYVLGNAGLAEGFPLEIEIDQPIHLMVGVTNRDTVPLQFKIEARQSEDILATIPAFSVESGETVEQPLMVVPSQLAENAEIQLVLFEEAIPTPVRTVRLFLSINPPSIRRFWGG